MTNTRRVPTLPRVVALLAMTIAGATLLSSAWATTESQPAESGPPPAGPTADSPSIENDPAARTLMTALSRATRLVASDATRPEKLEGLRQVSLGLIDAPSMANATLGAVLEARAPEEQQEFNDLFAELIVRAYLQKLLFFRKPRFGFARLDGAGDRVTVYTRILTPKESYSVTYDMRSFESAWRATDIRVEGVSLMQNYTAQFQSYLERNTFDDLMNLLRRKVHGMRQSETE